MPVKVKFPSFGSSVVRVGNVWYPENQKKIADEVTQKDCQWSRIFSDWKVCLTHEEYVNNLLLMRCHTYSWNFLNIPYCRNPDE